eukprot:gb/GFBE01079487.1/.p1 GENE.gb/GFBE01079487.1/~~gb/GFBE01079487.1/.p1  ORF type:complete len:585 (+),score=88.38 gb/GFBE01079487.1/:1-1755(+)
MLSFRDANLPMVRGTAAAPVLMAILQQVLMNFASGAVLCSREGYGPQRQSHVFEQIERHTVVYMPPYTGQQFAVWLITAGTSQTAEHILHETGLKQFAEEKGFGYVALTGDGHPGYNLFNVIENSWADPDGPDDVEYVRMLLHSLQVPCVDQKRIHCAGYSNGARFCAKLASELSDVMASVATVAGLRFPHPNLAERQIPIIAFHGTADKINPWDGHGNPSYWHQSVLGAFRDWGEFNKCQAQDSLSWVPIAAHTFQTEFNGCKDHADVRLVKIEGGHHAWPSCTLGVESKHPCNKDINVNEMIWDFFVSHTLHSPASASTTPQQALPQPSSTSSRQALPQPSSTSSRPASSSTSSTPVQIHQDGSLQDSSTTSTLLKAEDNKYPWWDIFHITRESPKAEVTTTPQTPPSQSQSPTTATTTTIVITSASTSAATTTTLQTTRRTITSTTLTTITSSSITTGTSTSFTTVTTTTVTSTTMTSTSFTSTATTVVPALQAAAPINRVTNYMMLLLGQAIMVCFVGVAAATVCLLLWRRCELHQPEHRPMDLINHEGIHHSYQDYHRADQQYIPLTRAFNSRGRQLDF